MAADPDKCALCGFEDYGMRLVFVDGFGTVRVCETCILNDVLDDYVIPPDTEGQFTPEVEK